MSGATAAVSDRSPPEAVAREHWLLRPIFRTEGLREQLLVGIAVLLVVALLALVCALLLWLPAGPSPGRLFLGVLGLVAVDTAVVLLFGQYLIRKHFLQPVERMVEGAEAIASGDLTRTLEEGGSLEMRRLARSLDRMAGRLIRNQNLLAENVRSLNETNRTLTETRNELIHAAKLASVGRLAAGVAHEVGNPLGAILGYLEVAERRALAPPEWVGEVRREAERLDHTVRGLLDFARPRAASERQVDVTEVAREATDLLESQGRLRRVALELELPTDLPKVRGDPFHLQQVLVNLLLNAVDAVEATGRSGGLTVRAASETYRGPSLARQPARRSDDPEGVDYSHLRRFRRTPTLRAPAFVRGAPIVRIEVLDDGVGLSSDEASQIFEPFFTTKEPGRGDGLGLAVSARLVEGMGGVISAEPRPEGGARFSVLLPTATPENAKGGGG